MEQQQSNPYRQLLDDSKAYLKLRYDLLRLELLDKISQIVGLVVMLLVVLFIALAATAYFSVALVNWMALYMPLPVAYCIIGGVFLLTAILLILLRKPLFINPLIKQLSRILFAKPNETGSTADKGGTDETDV